MLLLLVLLAPQWTDDSHVAALTDTLTALALAGVPVSSTSFHEALESLRRLVIFTAALAEAEVEFTLRPRNVLRPRMVEIPTSSGDNAIVKSIFRIVQRFLTSD